MKKWASLLSLFLSLPALGQTIKEIHLWPAASGAALADEMIIQSSPFGSDSTAMLTLTQLFAVITGGAGIVNSPTGTIATASSEADFLTSGALTCGASTQGKAQVHTTPLQYCDNAATPALQYAAYGSSTGESTAAANNSVALGTDTTGNYVATVADAGNTTITVANSGSETAGVTLDVIDVNCTGCLGTTEVSGLADGDVSDTLTASTSTTAAADDNDTSIATTAFVQQEHADSAGSCTNQLVSAFNADAAPTCSSVAAAMMANADHGAVSWSSGVATVESIQSGTAFPGAPNTGDVFVVTDDSAAGACDSAAGSAKSICRWSGSAWQAIGDGGSGGSGDSITVNTTAATDANLKDSATVTFAIDTGASPDDITATAIDVTCTGCLSATELAASSVDESELDAAIALADSDFLDLSAINVSSTTEGLKLPQATSCASGTAEGQICWDTDNNLVQVGDGAATKTIGQAVATSLTGSINASAVRYFQFQGVSSAATAAETGSAMILPIGITPSILSCGVGTAPNNGAGSQTVTFTLRSGGSDTDWACTITEAETTCSDSTGSAVAAGDPILFSATPANTPSVSTARCSLVYAM